MALKKLTNRQVLRNMVNSLGDIEIAILRSHLLHITDEVIKEQHSIRDQMGTNIIHPDLWIHTMVQINQQLEFKNN